MPSAPASGSAGPPIPLVDGDTPLDFTSTDAVIERIKAQYRREFQPIDEEAADHIDDERRLVLHLRPDTRPDEAQIQGEFSTEY